MDLPQVEIFTDGACKGNPGVGGWGALLRDAHGHQLEIYGAEAYTTNNRMELRAVIESLSRLKRPCIVTVTTDSRYVQQGIEQWINKWLANNWRNSQAQPVKNSDLWQQLLAAAQPHQLHWRWVKGHAGHAENERADQLANLAIQQLPN